MKAIKCVLSIALALGLGIAVFAPAVSAETDPNAPIITMQPKSSVYVFAGNTLNLEVAATLPAGSNGTLRIDWYDYDWRPGDETPPVATGTKAAIPTVVSDVSIFGNGGPFLHIYYYAVATCTYEDGEGQVQTSSERSALARVNVIPPLGKVISDTWEFVQLGRGPAFGILTIALFSSFLVPAVAFTLFAYLGFYMASLVL